MFLIQQMAAGLFRTVAGLCRSMIISNTGGALSVLIIFVLGGFILPKGTHSGHKTVQVHLSDKIFTAHRTFSFFADRCDSEMVDMGLLDFATYLRIQCFSGERVFGSEVDEQTGKFLVTHET